jgi:glycosyltransferase involved in cell wall biosynthesis
MKIALVVHGRFHAFDLAHALQQGGHTVKLLTNYPHWATRRFGIPDAIVQSFWPHGVLSRVAWMLHEKARVPFPEAQLHRLFGRWAARTVRKESWDVIYCWSGVAEELLREGTDKEGVALLCRGSAHIRTQARILTEEEQRTGIALERPSRWMIEREEREYQLAERIAVLSRFAYESFIAEGIPAQKLCLIPLGVDQTTFRPSRQSVEARCQRLLADEPLRVLYVGAVSLQKGMWDLQAIMRVCDSKRFRFRLVGPVAPEARQLVNDLSEGAEWIPKQPQASLPRWYAWGDVFIFPSLQDGFAQVLTQASASALPILATANCAGPEVLREGETGWVLPIRSPRAFLERLSWCDVHREKLATMVRRIYHDFPGRGWSQVAADFAVHCAAILQTQRRVEARVGEGAP